MDKLKWRESKYSDAFTKFIVTLLDDFNVEEAKGLLPTIVSLAQKDFFLKPLVGHLEPKAKKAILSILCQTEAMIEKPSEIFKDGSTAASTDALIQEVLAEKGYSSKLENGKLLLESF